MIDILSIEEMGEKPTIEMEDIDKLVEETRKAVAEADDILVRAKHNREKAVDNYTRALYLRTEFIERSIK